MFRSFRLPSYPVTQLRSYLIAAALVLTAAGCGRSSSSNPAIELVNPDSPQAYVQVSGLPGDVLDALEDATPEQWAAAFTVAVAADAPAMLGSYAVEDGTARFTPAFPLDQGREY